MGHTNKDFLTGTRKNLFTIRERIPLLENRRNVARIYAAFGDGYRLAGRFKDAAFHYLRGAKRMDDRQRRARLLAGLLFMDGTEKHDRKSYHTANRMMEDVLRIRALRKSASKTRRLAKMVQALPYGK